ncbi:hypothetical protein ACO9S2_15340 [Nitrospira sp. NS4]|uniref:hypothetical protein n=1 Tax=Nitrospira sp. NS4 TaxID=3414498 RepID=UPI003C2BC2CA
MPAIVLIEHAPLVNGNIENNAVDIREPTCRLCAHDSHGDEKAKQQIVSDLLALPRLNGSPVTGFSESLSNLGQVCCAERAGRVGSNDHSRVLSIPMH